MPHRFFLRLLSAAAGGDHVPDAELLRRFNRDHDPAAFELLARRHAPAVWAACRRILQTEADAEDAFQAAFLALARKGGSIRGACVGGWLHRVAVNAALRARERAARAVAVPPHHLDSFPAPPAGDSDDEVAAVVQEELGRLPERYRLPVVLCDLEGQTHTEAAKTLGWPVGSVSGRLSRAHALLRDRLTRRGLAPAVGAAVVLPAGSPPTGAVAAVVAAAAGTVPVPMPVSILTEGVLSAMRTAKLQLTVAVAASIGLLGLIGAGTVLAWPRTVPPAVTVLKPEQPLAIDAPIPPEPPIEGDWLPKKITNFDSVPTAFPGIKVPQNKEKGNVVLARACPRLFGEGTISIEPTDDTRRRLLKARLHQGAQEYQGWVTRIEVGQYQSTELPAVYNSIDDVLAVVMELWAGDPKNLAPRLEEVVFMTKQIEGYTLLRVFVGTDPPQFANKATRHRLAAEAVLWKIRNPKSEGR